MRDIFAFDEVLALGVDPHRESLDVVGIRFPEEIVLDQVFDNTRVGHHALWSKAKALATEYNLSLVFGLEDGSNYGYTLGRYLVDQGCRVKEVNPRMTNRQRDFYGEDKTNHLDALATAAIVLRAYERLPDVAAVQEATQATQELSRYRERLVKEQTANLNRLHRYLANQYPAYNTFFSKVNGITALNFWATYPTPAHLQVVTSESLADFFYEKSNHRLRKAAGLQKAQLIFQHLEDSPLQTLDMLTEAQGAIIRDLAQRLLQLKRSIETIEARLAETVQATGQQLETIEGMGTVLAAVFIGETRDTARFKHDKNRFASYNGSGPATKGTGKHARQVENHWCNRRLKWALNQLARSAGRHEPLSAQYYQACLDRGLDPGEARKRLMRRLSDIVFAMMRDKTPYDPEIHRRKQQLHKGKGKSVAAAVAGDQALRFSPLGSCILPHPKESVKQPPQCTAQLT
jgi:transposase